MVTRTFLAATGLLLAAVAASPPALGQEVGCIPPAPPFVPSDPRDVQTYADLLRQDFETYIAEFEAYMRCLDTERVRAFQEGQAVIREYGRFQELTHRLGPPGVASVNVVEFGV